MDPVRDKFTRCYRCEYYVCVCIDEKRAALQSSNKHVHWKEGEEKSSLVELGKRVIHAVNHVDTISRRRYKLDVKDFELGRTIENGPWFTARVARLRCSDNYFVLKSCSKSSAHHKHVENEREILAALSGLQEAKRITRLHHYFPLNRGDKTHLLLEHIPAGQLLQLIRRQGILNIEQVKYYSSQLILAIEFLQTNSVAHRDIHPGNILLDCAGRCKLGGFSTAKRMGSTERTLTMVGTAPYMDPQILSFQGYSRNVDLYSLGACVYEMVQGAAPFAEMPLSDFVNTCRDCPDTLVLKKLRRVVDVRAWDIARGLLNQNEKERETFAATLRAHDLFKFFNEERFQWDMADNYSPPFEAETDAKRGDLFREGSLYAPLVTL